jgi:hypothetical protein
MAHYAAVNGAWASRTTLRNFATTSGFALADFKGVNRDQPIRQAQQLLAGHGVEPPPPVACQAARQGEAAQLPQRNTL